MIYCTNHPEREAGHHCASCEKGFCPECAIPKRFEHLLLHLCPGCARALTELKVHEVVPPLWQRLPAALSFPLRGRLWWLKYLAFILFWILVRGFIMQGFQGFPAYVVLTSFVLPFALVYFITLASYFYKIFLNGEGGDFAVPEVFSIQTRKVDSMLGPLADLIGTVVGSLLPVIALYTLFELQVTFFAGKGLWQLEGPAYYIYYAGFTGLLLYWLFILPMALMVQAVSKNLASAINHFVLIKQIKKIPGSYVFTYLVLLMLMLAYVGAKAAAIRFADLDQHWVKIIYYSVDSASQVYLFMFAGHVLGYLAYQHRHLLGWSTLDQEVAVFMVDGKPRTMGPEQKVKPVRKKTKAALTGTAVKGPEEVMVEEPTPLAPETEEKGPEFEPGSPEDLEQKLEQANEKYEQGLFSEAGALYQYLLDHEPDHLPALRGMVSTRERQNDHLALNQCGWRLAKLLFEQKEDEELLNLMTEIQKTLPDFTIMAEALWSLSGWLTNQERHLEAARLLRELGVRYPEHELAPGALKQCAGLLWHQCDQLAIALHVLELLAERYPQAPFGAEVQEDLESIKELIHQNPEKYL